MTTSRLRILGTAAGTLLLTALAAHATSPTPGPCTQQVEAQKAATPPAPGAYVPQCTAQGYFQLVQTRGSTGYSWCVNPKTGAKVPGTERQKGQPAPTC